MSYRVQQEHWQAEMPDIVTEGDMRTFWFLAFVLFLASGGNIEARSQSQMRGDSDLITDAEHAWAKAAVEKDVDAFAKYLSGD